MLNQPALADDTTPQGAQSIVAVRINLAAGLNQETICLQVDGRMFLARGQMSLNVSMWREMQQECFTSSLQRPLQLLQSRSVDAEVTFPKS
jgi:hypothetical protein